MANLKTLIEKIKMIPKGVFPNMAINLNLAIASAYVKDFDAAGKFLEKTKKEPNFDKETYMYYQTIINALKTSEGRKEVIYNSLP